MQITGNAWYAINFDAEKGICSDNEHAIETRDLIAKFMDEAIYPSAIETRDYSNLDFYCSHGS